MNTNTNTPESAAQEGRKDAKSAGRRNRRNRKTIVATTAQIVGEPSAKKDDEKVGSGLTPYTVKPGRLERQRTSLSANGNRTAQVVGSPSAEKNDKKVETDLTTGQNTIKPGRLARQKKKKENVKTKKKPDASLQWKCVECDWLMPENQRAGHLLGKKHKKSVHIFNRKHAAQQKRTFRPRLRETTHAGRVKLGDKVIPLVSGDFHGLAGQGRSVVEGKSVKNQRVHPNGQRKIPIEWVKNVYGLPYPIPLEAFGCVYQRTKVTPESVEAAIDVVNSQDFFHLVEPTQQLYQKVDLTDGRKSWFPRHMFKDGLQPGPRDFY